MQDREQLVELITRITAQVLRETQGVKNELPVLSQAPAKSCSIEDDGLCNGCGQCATLLPRQVEEVIDAGAARIGGAIGVGHGLKDSLAGLIDHTLLKPQATREDLRSLCDEARKHRFASVCVNPVNVAFCVQELKGSGVPVAAVVGFPLGASTPEIKAAETRQAIENGASEIDMVINVGALKDRNFQLILEEIACVVRAARGKMVKVILETALLDEVEKIAACTLSRAAGAHYVKTSTGFGPGGATVEDIELMRHVVGKSLGVKASGGIRGQEVAMNMLQAGATRLGASASVAVVEGRESSSSY